MTSGIKEAERELEKVEETIAMADRAIQISRLENERLSSELAAAESEQAELSGPAVEQV
jgi:chromosome segregation ATPase